MSIEERLLRLQQSIDAQTWLMEHTREIAPTAAPLLVTVTDVSWLVGGRVAAKTIKNRGAKDPLPAVVGKRGKKRLRHYGELLTWWRRQRFTHDLPAEAEAREMLAQLSNRDM
jgi:hypothetical protein